MLFEYRESYPAGTFNIGDTIYSASFRTHRYRFRKECCYCDSTGRIELKGNIFTCPACEGEKDYKEVNEMVIDKIGNIKSKIIFQHKDEAPKEIYYTNEFSGIIIHEPQNSNYCYFNNKEEAQAFCDDYNKKNNVEMQMMIYSEKQIRSEADGY